MKYQVTVYDPSEIEKINSEIHDWFFNLEQVTFDSDLRILKIPFKKKENRIIRKFFRLKRSQKDLEEDYILEIKHVKDYKINDIARVGYYDFNIIEYDSLDKIIKVTTGIPIELIIYITDYELSVMKV